MLTNIKQQFLLVYVLFLFFASVGDAQTVVLSELNSFPSAEGYGKNTCVGQSIRTVKYVTNLNDSGPGSLREAIGVGSNILVVFKVAGTITLSSDISSAGDNIYIAGQTAFYDGGQGITLRNDGVNSGGLMTLTGNHIVIRYIRFRRGSDNRVNGSCCGDNLNLFGGSDWIMDHCSFSWSTDENVNAGPGDRGTMQYCLSSEGLYFANHTYSTDPNHGTYQTGHSKGALFGWSGANVNEYSFYRNLFAHNDGRNPQIYSSGGTFELVNNLMYNNRYFNIALVGADPNSPMMSNVVKNLLIPGRDTRLVRHMVHARESTYDQIYMQGNIGVHRTNDNMDEWIEVGQYGTPSGQTGRAFTSFSTPMEAKYGDLPDAAGLQPIVLNDVGANLNPDAVDVRVINDVINRTPTASKTVQGTDPNAWTGQSTYYGIINDPAEVGGWPSIAPMNSIVQDANNDGIDDVWASAHGISHWSDVKSEYTFGAMTVINHAGYTARQMYLAWLAGDFDRIPVRPVTCNISMLLEGVYDSNSGIMKSELLQMNLLPSGQPYTGAPWDYSGTEGTGWTSADYPTGSIDWVMVSLRTDASVASQFARFAGVLLEDGTVNLLGQPSFNTSIESAYVVVQHRNHLPAMSTVPVSIANNTLTYDFTSGNSYSGNNGYGQQQINGKWMLYTGNVDQTNPNGYEITGADKVLWQVQNGNFGLYDPTDFNMDSDVTGADRILWSNNNGIFSDVPK